MPSWYDSRWTYRRALTVDNTGNASTLTLYPAKITLSAGNFNFAHANSNGSDLRFTDSDGTTLLPHWLESFDSVAQTGVAWVRIPSISGSSSVTVYAYYGNSSAPSISNERTVFTFADDFANDFEEYASNPVISIGSAGAWDETICGDPDVHAPNETGDSLYHCYYFGYSSTSGKAQIGHATSSDGIAWTKDAANPIVTNGGSGAWDEKYAQKPDVQKDSSGTLVMYYSGQSASGATAIGLATASSWSGPWTKYASNPVVTPTLSYEGTYVDCPSTVLSRSTKKLWYSCDTVISGEPKSWAYATATNYHGPWTKNASAIATPPGDGTLWARALGGLRVSQDDYDGRYVALFNAFASSDSKSRNFIIYSQDGVTWDLSLSQLMVDLGATGSWDDAFVYRPSHIVNDGTHKRVYFNAKHTVEQIGFATLGQATKPDTSLWKLDLNGTGSTITCAASEAILDHSAGGTGSALIAQTVRYLPAQNVILETRFRLTTVYDATHGQLHGILFNDSVNFPTGNNCQFLFADKGDGHVKHQSQSGGAFGSEDLVYSTFPTTGTHYRARAVKLSTGINWYWMDDSENVLGSLVGNTDAPINFSNLPFSIADRGAQVNYDWARVRQYTTPEPSVTVGSESTTGGLLLARRRAAAA